MSDRINLGCGSSPTEGWRNFDGSPSVKLAKRPFATAALRIMGLVNAQNLEYIHFIKTTNIEYANVTGKLPLPDNSCDVVYSSHMLEHINPLDVANFLNESMRVLQPGGIIRLAVPDLRRKAEEYIASGNADEFMKSTMVSDVWSNLGTLAGRLRFAIKGDPSAHKWMYDGVSLRNLLEQNGFSECEIMPEGTTKIKDPGSLDLSERCPESVFVEGRRPGNGKS